MVSVEARLSSHLSIVRWYFDSYYKSPFAHVPSKSSGLTPYGYSAGSEVQPLVYATVGFIRPMSFPLVTGDV